MAGMKPSSLTRREFLQSTAAAGSGAAIAAAVPSGVWGHESASPASRPVPAWASKPMRWFQLVLVENDPLYYSPKFWLDYFKRTRSEGVCLSGGGCVAYYPTEIPYQHRSRWLGGRDVLGELITGCRNEGISSIVVRTDPHATWNDTKEAHPDWIAVDVNGKPRPHWAMPDMWLTCAYGPYNFEFMTAVHKEIMSRYHVDGLFQNRWDGEGICYCVHCVANFRAATGFALPRKADVHDRVYRAWMEWRQERLMSLLDLWDRTIQEINADSACIPNGGGALYSLDDVQLSKRVPMLAADRQGRAGLETPWFIGKTAKEYRATLGSKPAIGLFNVGLEDRYRWKDSVTSEAEIRIWVYDAIANGMVPWCCKFSGTLHDDRWLPWVEEIFVWTEKNRKYLVQGRPIARVAIVYSQRTAWFYGGHEARAKVENYALGWCQALNELRIPFEMVHDELMDAAHLEPYKTLILPNIAVLNEAQCDQLRAFVGKGGSLIATYETSLYDETGAARKNFLLADLFGVDWTGKTQGPMLNSYIRLEHEALPKSPFFAGLEDAPRVINGVYRVETTPREPFAETPFTLIPSYPDLPMEEVFPRQPHTNISCLYLREAGGRVAYFPFDIDRTFWNVLSGDHLKIMRNTLQWANNETPAVEVEGPGVLDVTAWRNPNSITVHLVNLTNPMEMKGPYRTFFPMGPQKVRLRLPELSSAQEAHLLVAGTTVGIERAGSEVSVTVPSVLDHEVVAIDV